MACGHVVHDNEDSCIAYGDGFGDWDEGTLGGAAPSRAGPERGAMKKRAIARKAFELERL
jgi:hypothetical protein